MFWLRHGVFLLGGLIFAAFSSSPSYQLRSYSIGAGATNSASSTTYKLQGNVGQQTNNSTSGTTYTAKNSSIQAEQINTPPAPTLSTNAGSYYNQINCTINTGSNPSDTTFAIAVSTTSNFTVTNYVQANGSLGASPVFQTNGIWGSGGFLITGLISSTTYYVKVSAMQGTFTNTPYGASANITTGAPTLSFTVSPSSVSLGTFLPNAITTSSNMSFTFVTNGTSGGSIYVGGQYAGFDSPSKGFLIAATSGNLSSLSSGFGIQATNPSQTSGGPLTTVSPYNGTSHTVGAESTSFAQMLKTSASIVGGTANANVQVLAGQTTPPASDYTEVFTFVASASF